MNGGSKNSDKAAWKLAALLTVILRVAYSLCAAVMALLQPVNQQLMRSNALTEGLPSANHGLRYLFLGVWERFDTLWYLHLAAHGYDRPDAVVFFPLYPALIRALSWAMPAIVAALTVSAIAAFFLFWGLQELLRLDFTEQVAFESVVFCAVWPGSFVFFAGYSESLLLALIVWSLWMAQTNRWAAAIVLGVAAASTKAVGVVVVVPLMIIAARRKRIMILPSLLVVVVSIACTQYVQRAGGDTLTDAYRDFWRTTSAAPWSTIHASVSALFHAPNPILILNLLCLVLVCVLVSLSRARIEHLLYAAAVIALVLCKQTVPPLQSMIRYMLIVFPAFVGSAKLRRASSDRWGFVSFCVGLFIVNMGLLWLFEGWSLAV